MGGVRTAYAGEEGIVIITKAEVLPLFHRGVSGISVVVTCATIEEANVCRDGSDSAPQLRSDLSNYLCSMCSVFVGYLRHGILYRV
ncbi:unnamed protein product [Laminaria digitata]